MLKLKGSKSEVLRLFIQNNPEVEHGSIGHELVKVNLSQKKIYNSGRSKNADFWDFGFGFCKDIRAR